MQREFAIASKQIHLYYSSKSANCQDDSLKQIKSVQEDLTRMALLYENID